MEGDHNWFDMLASFDEPSFFRMACRDRLSFAGFILWVAASLSLVALPALFRNMSALGTMVFAAFPFAAGALFIVPRRRLHRRLYREGRIAEGKVVTKVDVSRPRSGSRIMYRYSYAGREYQNEIRLHWLVEDLQSGAAVAVLLNPERPSESLLPVLYV